MLHQLYPTCTSAGGAALTAHWDSGPASVCGLMFLCRVCVSAAQPWIHRGTTVRPGTLPLGRRRSKPGTTPWCSWSSSACYPSTCLWILSASCWELNRPTCWCFSCEFDLTVIICCSITINLNSKIGLREGPSDAKCTFHLFLNNHFQVQLELNVQ